VPRWKTKITIDITVATAVKNFLKNYAEIHGLPSPDRNVNRIIQSLTLLPAEMSYKSVYRDFIAGLENDSTLKLLKYGAFRKLWHQLTPYYIQIMSPRTDLPYVTRANIFGTAYSIMLVRKKKRKIY